MSSTVIGLVGGEKVHVKESIDELDRWEREGYHYWLQATRIDGARVELRRDQIAWRQEEPTKVMATANGYDRQDWRAIYDKPERSVEWEMNPGRERSHLHEDEDRGDSA